MEMFIETHQSQKTTDRLHPSTCTKLTFTIYPAAKSNTEQPSEAEMKIHIPLLSSVWPLHVLQEPQSICNTGNIRVLLLEVPLQKHVIMRGKIS
jgi:hypothetical protein